MALKGQTALITGGGKNPGSERARELAKDGANLALHYSSSKSKSQTIQVRDEVVKAHPSIKVSIHGGDLTTSAAVESLFSEVLAEHKKIDIVVNTAGIVLQKPTSNLSAAEYDKMFAYAVFVDEQRRNCVDQFRAESVRMQQS